MFNPTTCVRLRYGFLQDMLSGFSWRHDYARCPRSPEGVGYSQVRLSGRICLPESTPTPFNGLFRQPAALSRPRRHVALAASTGILTGSAIGIAAISVDQETLVLRRAGFSPALSLLIPTFAFPHAPVRLAPRLRRHVECSPTNTMCSGASVGCLCPIIIHAGFLD